MQTKLVSITPNAEELIVYCARVSSARTEEEKREEPERLINYLIKHEHWSPFEMANMVVEVVTSRAIARQILRHRSFSFQEFSQRYATQEDVAELITPRKAGATNRQSSIEYENTNPENLEKTLAIMHMNCAIGEAYKRYAILLKMGVAPECARMILPECTQTRLYINGTMRSWIHYLQLRTKDDTQKEHREVASSIQDTIFKPNLPIVSAALGWK